MCQKMILNVCRNVRNFARRYAEPFIHVAGRPRELLQNSHIVEIAPPEYGVDEHVQSVLHNLHVLGRLVVIVAADKRN